jgi:hypothetical protein
MVETGDVVAQYSNRHISTLWNTRENRSPYIELTLKNPVITDSPVRSKKLLIGTSNTTGTLTLKDLYRVRLIFTNLNMKTSLK